MCNYELTGSHWLGRNQIRGTRGGRESRAPEFFFPTERMGEFNKNSRPLAGGGQAGDNERNDTIPDWTLLA